MWLTCQMVILSPICTSSSMKAEACAKYCRATGAAEAGIRAFVRSVCSYCSSSTERIRTPLRHRWGGDCGSRRTRGSGHTPAGAAPPPLGERPRQLLMKATSRSWPPQRSQRRGSTSKREQAQRDIGNLVMEVVSALRLNRIGILPKPPESPRCRGEQGPEDVLLATDLSQLSRFECTYCIRATIRLRYQPLELENRRVIPEKMGDHKYPLFPGGRAPPRLWPLATERLRGFSTKKSLPARTPSRTMVGVRGGEGRDGERLDVVVPQDLREGAERPSVGMLLLEEPSRQR